MPVAHPEEFRRRAVELARQPGARIALIASDLGISESCLRRWMKVDDVDAGRREGLTRTVRAELAQLRLDKKRLETEVESSNAPAPTSRGRMSSQNSVLAGP